MNKILILAVFLIATNMLSAQDPHFSQFHASPLTLSPAMTGYMQSDYRVAANFRTQYWSIGSSFSTGTFSYESKINKSGGGSNDGFAIGLMGIYDQSSGGAFKSMNLSLSGAYHRALDANKTQILSIGFQASFTSRNLNAYGLTFANQFTSGGFDLTLPNNEMKLNSSRSYGGLNSGLMYSYSTEKNKIYLGGALYNINRPDVSFYNDKPYKLPIRYGMHAGGKLQSGESNYIQFSACYMKQANATDLIGGAAYVIDLSNEEGNFDISGGCWYRHKDAIIPYFGTSFSNYQLGFSYDILTSGLKSSSPRTGGFEISMKYNGHKKANPYNLYNSGGAF